jgi:hypothetical protein
MREAQVEQPSEGNQLKRAISLAGGGPAAGLHIGALKKLAEENIRQRSRIFARNLRVELRVRLGCINK